MAGAIHRVEQAKIDAARLTQKAHNEESAAQSELQRFSALLSNRRRMDAAGEQIAQVNSAVAKNIDAKAMGDLQQQIAFAEELGANTTMASAAGVAGSSIDMYNSTMRLTDGLNQGQQDRAFAQDTFAANKAKGDVMIDAVAGLDNNQYRANLDYRRWADHKKMGVFQQIATLGLAAAATYVGGPQAGMAVVGLSEAMNDGANGDFASASAGVSGAIKMGVSAYRDTRDIGGNWWGKSRNVPQIGAKQKY